MIPAIEEERKKERKWLEYLRYLRIYRRTNMNGGEEEGGQQTLSN
jgi:hypothetical protein